MFRCGGGGGPDVLCASYFDLHTNLMILHQVENRYYVIGRSWDVGEVDTVLGDVAMNHVGISRNNDDFDYY